MISEVEDFNLHSHTVHLAIIKVSTPTDAQVF